MEIRFAKILLAGADDADPATGAPSSPAGLAFDGSRLVQIDELPRADHPAFRDRQNKSTGISFSVTRQHESYGAAEIFVLTHAEDLPVQGDLILRGFNNDGAPLQRLARNAVLVNVRSLHAAGVRTEHSYQFLVGELQKSNLVS